MWTCQKCERNFKTRNQSHMCAIVSIDDLFIGKPDNLLIAFDALLVGVIDWHPGNVGATKKAIVFAKEKAWLIVKPMSKLLDIKFYSKEKFDHHLISKSNFAMKKMGLSYSYLGSR
jgi:hypothetical protein